jgi:hypothetical protein
MNTGAGATGGEDAGADAGDEDAATATGTGGTGATTTGDAAATTTGSGGTSTTAGSPGVGGGPIVVTGGSGGTDASSGGTGGGSGGDGGTGGSGGTGGTGMDICPGDPLPSEDYDGDGTPDCLEECPDNDGQTEPTGACGCSDSTNTSGCTTLRNALAHLYTFDGTGNTIEDSVGSANGTLVSGGLQQHGRVTFDGAAYVELPSGIISSLTNATLETWFVWQGGGQWERVFDFGNNDGANGETYVFLTPLSGDDVTRGAFTLSGNGNETQVDHSTYLPNNTIAHVAVVLDAAGSSMRLYVDGTLADSATFDEQLSALEDDNNWLGRSQFSADGGAVGVMLEFRIYDVALSDSQVSTSFQAGPGALKE